MFRSYKDTIRTPVKVSREAAKKYLCDLCDDDQSEKVWESEVDLEIHRRRYHNVEIIQLMQEPKNYMCSVCLRQQADKAALIAHIKTDHLLSAPDSSQVKREMFICGYCKNIFFNKTLLAAHIKAFHLHSSVEKKFATTLCPICDKNIKIRSIWFHFLYHGIITTSTCPICLTPFDDHEDVLKHIECHPGHYLCFICSYETNKESLFQSHIEKHKRIVNLEGKSDVSAVSKYFVPEKRFVTWNRKVVNIFKGITLAPEIQICILCRTMCETDEQMLQHIYGDHSPLDKVEITRYLCKCGEEFFNRVLLKHHIFVLKGDHRVYDGKEPLPVKKELPSDKCNATADTNQQENVAGEVFDIVIKTNDDMVLIDDCNPTNTAVDSNTTDKSQENTQENMVDVQYHESKKITENVHILENIEIHSQENTNDEQNEIIQENTNDEQNEIIQENTNDEQLDNTQTEIQIDVHTDIEMESQDLQQETINNETNNEVNIDGAEFVIQTQNLNKYIEELAEIKSNIVSYNLQNDQIIIDGKRYTLELSDQCRKSLPSDGHSVELVAGTNVTQEESPKRVKKRTKHDVVELKDALSKKFKSTKQFYEQVLSINGEIDETCDSVKSSVEEDSSQEPVLTPEPSQEVAVYEVIEVIGNANEDTEKTGENSEDPLLYS